MGRDVATVVGDLGAVYRDLGSDSQLRWLGPDKGVEHLAMAAVMNAVWDLAARVAGKPLWRLLVDMTPEELVDAADLTYLSDVLTRDEAIAILARTVPTRAERVAELERTGYPCYTTSAGCSATPTTSCAASPPRPSPRGTGTSSSRWAPTWRTTSGVARSRAR